MNMVVFVGDIWELVKKLAHAQEIVRDSPYPSLWKLSDI